MLDEETSREVDRIAREAAEAAQRGGSGADVLAAIYELQALLADVCHSYGMDGGEAVPGNFEPEFADDNGTMKLDSVGASIVSSSMCPSVNSYAILALCDIPRTIL